MTPLRILHLEDNAHDAELVRSQLGAAGPDLDGAEPEVVVVDSRAGFEAALAAGEWGLILADYSLSAYDGLSALTAARAALPETPFIFVTGDLGEERAIEALQQGATDYVLKMRLSRLVPTVRRALREADDRAERVRAEAAAQAERERLRVTLGSIGDAVIATDTAARITFMNAVAEALTGWTQADAAGQPIAEVFRIINEHTRATVESPAERVLREGVIAGLANHTLLIARDGSEIPIDDSGAPIRDARGQTLGVVLVFRDIRERKAAEAALGASEERYRTLVETHSAIVWAADASGQVVQPQPQWEAYTGQAWPAYRGSGWLAMVHPDERKPMGARWAAAVAAGEPLELFGRLWNAASNSYSFFEARAAPLRRAGGQVREWIGTFTDVNARKLAEAALAAQARRQAVVAGMSQRALAAGSDLQGLLDATVRELAATLGVEFCKVLELLPGGEQMRLRAGVGWQPGLVGNHTVSAARELQAGYALEAGAPVVVEDLRSETRFGRLPFLEAHGVISGLSVAIPGPDRPWGVLGAHTATRRAFTPDDVNFVQSAANVLGEVLARQAVEGELRGTRDQIAAILGGVAEGVTVQDASGRLTYANAAAARLLGYPSGEALAAAPGSEVLARFEVLDENGDPFPLAELPWRRVLQGEREAATQLRLRVPATGEERWSEVRARPILDAAGQPSLAVNIFHDISELKQSEQAQRLLADAGQLLTSALEEEALLRGLIGLAVPALADYGLIYQAGPDGRARAVAHAHRDPALAARLAAFAESVQPSPDQPGSLVGQVLRSGESRLIPTYSADHLGALPQAAAARLRPLEPRSALAVPLVTRGRVLGALVLARSTSQTRYTAADLALVQELARRAGLALDNARLYAEAQQLNAELEVRVQARTEQLTAALKQLRASNAELEAEVEERQAAEARLRQSERRLAEAQAIAELGSWHWDVANNVVSFSDELYRIYGRDPRTFTATFEGVLEAVHPDDRERARAVITAALESGQPFELDHRIVRPDGGARALHVRGEVSVDAAGQAVAITGIGHDVTEYRRIEAEVRESRELLRQLSGRLEAAREEERTRIAREIHDELGGALTGLKMDLARLANHADTLAPEAVRASAREISAQVDSTVKTVRRIATDLRPGILDDFGLAAAIEWQLQEFEQRAGIECVFEGGADDLPLRPEAATALFRIFQETLTNVARHAQARLVEVRLEAAPDGLVLEVQDNGRGIAPHEIEGSHSLGLLGMRERVRMLSGTLDIEGQPGQGTRVRVRVPLGAH